MHPANLRSLDLNLLVVLDALLRERHVTRAAQALAMTQPAVSQALGRLRALFDDVLLERHGRDMRLSARGEALAAPLRQILADVRALARPTLDDPASQSRTLRLSWPDVAALTLLPPLLAALATPLPRLTLVCVGWALADAEPERLRSGQVDLALSSATVLPPDLRRERLGQFGYVGIARRGHPLFTKRATAEGAILPAPAWPRLVTQGFVLVSATGQTRSELDGYLESAGLKRRVVAVLPNFLSVPPLIAATDLLAYVPMVLARWWAPRGELLRFTAPSALTAAPVDLLWHRRHDSDPVHQLVRDTLAGLTRSAFSTPGPAPAPDVVAAASRAD